MPVSSKEFLTVTTEAVYVHWRHVDQQRPMNALERLLGSKGTTEPSERI
jgi:hypothetical protein